MRLVFFKMALKMLCKIASQLAHSELTKGAFREQLSLLLFTFYCLLSEVTSDAILGTANGLGKYNDEFNL